ncbi:DUF3987 domain-containing protein [Caballeronia glebae]|uniref:DUF3987 domain-containing protein n=1 Tax=Caballeronia glebae TaxID=1777143 RepID=UPI0038BD2302
MSAVLEKATFSKEAYKEAAGRLFHNEREQGYKPVGLHLYRLPTGPILYARVRMHKPAAEGVYEKLIRPFFHDGIEWKRGEPKQDNGKLLYGLADVQNLPQALVIVGEGEQKADELTKIGAGRLAGVTSGSASSASHADWSPLAGRHVLLWPDFDEPGSKYVDAIAAKLQVLGCALQRVDVAALDLPHKGDVMDWAERFRAAHDRTPTADDVLALPMTKAVPLDPPIGDPAEIDVWPAPQLLSAMTAPLDYPIESLPPRLRAAVEEVHRFVQAPLALVASTAVAALSLAIQAHVDVKRAERLTGPVGLFMLTIADSGERKSTCDTFFTRAIRDYEAEQAVDGKFVIDNYQADLAAWEANYNGVKEKIKSTAKAGKQSTTDLREELRDLEHDKPVQPKVPRLVYADVTPEALAFSLYKQWPSGGVVSAEAGIVFGSHGMGADSVMRNLATLNQLWDGNSLTIDRRTSDSYTVRGARLTVALQVQAATLRSFFDRSGALARGTGFLARFLIAWPQSTQGYRLFKDAPDDWPHLDAFNQRIADILRLPIPTDEGGNLVPVMLPLSPEAKDAWTKFHDEVEVSLRTGGELCDVRDVASKSADNAARLAALFHMFSGDTGPIAVDALENASSIAAWHLSESKRFFSELAVPEDVVHAGRLDAWLIEHCSATGAPSVSRRDAQRLGPVRKREPLAEALQVLEDLGRLRVEQMGKQITVNPALLEGVAL